MLITSDCIPFSIVKRKIKVSNSQCLCDHFSFCAEIKVSGGYLLCAYLYRG